MRGKLGSCISGLLTAQTFLDSVYGVRTTRSEVGPDRGVENRPLAVKRAGEAIGIGRKQQTVRPDRKHRQTAIRTQTLPSVMATLPWNPSAQEWNERIRNSRTGIFGCC